MEKALPVEEKEDDTTYKKLIQFLDQSKVPYKLIEHHPTKTAKEAAEARGASLDTGGKSMLVKDNSHSTVKDLVRL